MSLRVYDLAHSRAGDKGNTLNLSVIAYDDEAYAHLDRHLTEERVLAAFDGIAEGPVKRYELPNIRAYNFVIQRALAGGVTTSPRLDPHGKSLSSLMLTIELPDFEVSS